MWHAKNYDGYDRTSQEAIDNANEIYNIFSSLGWSDNAIYTMIGCFQGECDLNPWQWESNQIPTYSQYLDWETSAPYDHGYGLPQFTPPSTYIANASSYTDYAPHFADITGSPTDGNAQCAYMDYHMPRDWQTGSGHGSPFSYYDDAFSALTPPVDITTGWNMTFNDFKTNTTASLQDLTVAYMVDYLRPAASTAASRFYNDYYGNVEYWYTYFQGHPPTPPGPTPGTRKKMPLYMMIKRQIY